MVDDAQLAFEALADHFAMLYISSGGTQWLYVNDGLGDRWFKRHPYQSVFELDEEQNRMTPPNGARASFSPNWTEMPIPPECRRG